MATSVADLLATLDHDRHSSFGHDPLDASHALRRIHLLLERLREDGIGASPAQPLRDDVSRRLSEACETAAAAFPGTDGRLTDLVAITTDAVGRLRPELTDDDRWSIAAALPITARHCQNLITSSGPYRYVPQLAVITDRCGELVRVAASDPPHPGRLVGIDTPIPRSDLSPGLTPARVAAESIAELVSYFRRGTDEPMSMRQLLAVCRAAEQTAAAGVIVFADPTEAQRSQAAQRAWVVARRTLSNFLDEPRGPRADPSRLMLTAARVHTGLTRAVGELTEPVAAADLQNLRFAGAQLPRLAAGCSLEFARKADALLVDQRAGPLYPTRTPEWLARHPFRAHASDLPPALNALRTAELQSQKLAGHPLRGGPEHTPYFVDLADAGELER